MHHSTDLSQRTETITHYVDDSGSDEQSKIAVVGGPVFDRAGYFPFSYEWDRLLRAGHRVKAPVHMREFARPHGRFAYLSNTERAALFSDLVKLINETKFYSATAVVQNMEFQEFFPQPEFRKLFGVAPLAFLWCLILNRVLIEWYDDLRPVAYVVSESSVNSFALVLTVSAV